MSTKTVRKDNDVLTYGRNFNTVAEARKTELGVTDQDLTQLTQLLKEYSDAIELATTLRVKSAAATTAKDTARTKVLDKTRKMTNKVKGEDDVPPALKRELGITIPEASTRNTLLPVTPADLVANLKTDGSVELYWLSNGNTTRTQYILEMQPDQSQAWTVVDVVSKTSFLHKEPPPAVDLKYRVSARRRGEISPPSNTATATLRRPVVG
jgi:hypothetical protein